MLVELESRRLLCDSGAVETLARASGGHGQTTTTYPARSSCVEKEMPGSPFVHASAKAPIVAEMLDSVRALAVNGWEHAHGRHLYSSHLYKLGTFSLGPIPNLPRRLSQ